MLRKFRVAVFAAAVLWLIVLVQIIATRIYVSQTGFAQAFARNQVTVLQEESQQQNADSRNAENGNICTEGVMPGRWNSWHRICSGRWAAEGFSREDPMADRIIIQRMDILLVCRQIKR